MYSDQSLYGQHIDIVVRRIDKADISAAQKAETALAHLLPILAPEVLPFAVRWVATADEQKSESSAIEELREMLAMHATRQKKGAARKGRARQIQASPVLEMPLWEKLLSGNE